MSNPLPGPPGAPDPSARTNKVLGYVLGILLIGPFLAVVVPIATLTVAGAAGGDDSLFTAGLILGIALPFLLPVALLFKRGTRPWGVGILIGVALTYIILGGICAGFIYLLSQEGA